MPSMTTVVLILGLALPAAYSFKCATGELSCDFGRCIKQEFVCDGYANCVDFSDESNCTTKAKCVQGGVFCESAKKCMRAQYKCDGRQDCPGGEDEKDCPKDQKPELFKCADGGSKKMTTKCDGHWDCPGTAQEDEKDCTACVDGAFLCDGVCLPKALKCDRTIQCSDFSDEKDCPYFKEKLSMKN